jgi:hypothetical protein
MIMCRKIVYASLVLLFTFWNSSANAQDTVNKMRCFGFEFGADFQSYYQKDFDFIRGDNSQYYYSSNQGLGSNLSTVHLGLRYEQSINNSRFSWSSGIVFTMSNSELFANTHGGSLFFLYKQSANTTEYLRLSNISQTATYVGVPLEFKFYFLDVDQYKFFLKGGVSVSYLADISSEVVFLNPAMDKYADQVISRFDEPGKLYSIAYLSPGIMFNFNTKFAASMEARLPLLFLSSSPSGFYDYDDAGGGIQFEIQYKF